MVSVRLHISRSEFFDPDDGYPDDSVQKEGRRAIVAATEMQKKGGTNPPRIRVSAMTEMKEYSGKD
uniref:Uncharacterized protein n=1 Tax=Peronospora matthiolae TaxID=2874970 RepID=A0AAV1TMM1_9STRA